MTNLKTKILEKLMPSTRAKTGLKMYQMEHEQGIDTFHESELHPSVFEENLHHSHPHPNFNKAAFSWIAPEYLQHPKSIRWWVWAVLILTVIVILEAFSGNWTMMVATVVFGMVYWYIHEHHPPKQTKINISELGIKVGHHYFHYADIEAFWILYDPGHVKRLCFRIKDKLLPDLILELKDQNPQEIRLFLEQHLSEVTGIKERFTDVLLRLFKL